jgi:hypothetical protein
MSFKSVALTSAVEILLDLGHISRAQHADGRVRTYATFVNR